MVVIQVKGNFILCLPLRLDKWFCTLPFWEYINNSVCHPIEGIPNKYIAFADDLLSTVNDSGCPIPTVSIVQY